MKTYQIELHVKVPQDFRIEVQAKNRIEAQKKQ